MFIELTNANPSGARKIYFNIFQIESFAEHEGATHVISTDHTGGIYLVQEHPQEVLTQINQSLNAQIDFISRALATAFRHV